MKQPAKELFALAGNDVVAESDTCLSISISDTHVSYAVSNGAGDVLYALKWFSLPEVTVNALDNLLQVNNDLSRSYANVRLAYLYPQTMLLPAGELSGDAGGQLLALVHGKADTDVVLEKVLANGRIRQVYAVPKDVHEWLQQHFPKAIFHHGYGPVVSRMEDATEAGLLAVDFRNEEWTVIAGASGKTLLAQTFPYHTPADVLFYLLKICQELGFRQETAALQLSGLVAEKSALYKELSQYFGNVVFREASWGSIENGDSSCPPHFFTSLNELSLCGS